MSRSLVSVVEAAAMLHVNPSRIHQRIREGSLPAEKVGNQWAIDLADVRRITHLAGAGRPLSAQSSWDLLAVALSDKSAAQLNPSARSRARLRLRNLLVRVASAPFYEAPALISRALQNRAGRALFFGASIDVRDARQDERLHLSGVSLPESNISAGDLAEGYVASDDLDALSRDYLLSPAPRSRANVILHVIDSGFEHPLTAALVDVVRSPLARASDLAEHDGVRERNQAVRALDHLHSRFVARERSE